MSHSDANARTGAERCAVDPTDHRHRTVVERPERAADLCHQILCDRGVHRRELEDVVAGAEHIARAGEQQRINVGVVRRHENCVQLVEQRCVGGVDGWPVEGHADYAWIDVIHLDPGLQSIHPVSLRSSAFVTAGL